MTDRSEKRTYGALILAGGAGRRMGGQNKALLRLDDRTFLARLEEALAGFEEKLISIRDASWLADTGFTPVVDAVAGRGPLEGLRCALQLCRSDVLVVVPCDVPLFSAELAQALMHAGAAHDAVICRDRTGKLDPLCGVYSKKCLPVIESLMAQEKYRVMNVFERVDGAVFALDTAGLSDDLLTNVNFPETLKELRGD